MSPIVTTAGGPAQAVRRGRVPGVVPPSGAAPFFTESFAGGQFNSADGFVWQTSAGSVSADRARTGTHSLKLTYGTAGIDNARYFLLGKTLTEIWVEYYLWWDAAADWLSDASSSNNNKLLRLWGPDITTGGSGYEADGNWKCGASIRSTPFTAFDATTLPESWRSNTASAAPIFSSTWLAGGGEGQAAMSASGPMIPGQWNRLRFYFKHRSAFNTADGAFRWDINDVTVAHTVATDIGSNTDTIAGLRRGYLMGWHATRYEASISHYLDDISFYDADPGWW